jgi:hypothetical protein
MNEHGRTLWDDLVEIGREVADRLNELLDPDYKHREPARVPVPVYDNPPQVDRDDNPYNQGY